jgi:hypothetical protein
VIGDMDGDSRPDRVAIAVNRPARLSCRYILVADLGDQVITTFIRQPRLYEPGGYPRLDTLARVNRGGAAQALVAFGGGAYVNFHGLYDLHQGRLVRMKVFPSDNMPPDERDAFGQGASSCCGLISSCARGSGSGTVLVVGVRPAPGTGRVQISRIGQLYAQHGESYRLVSWRHRLTAIERRNVVKRPPHGVRPQIFSNCAIAAAR